VTKEDTNTTKKQFPIKILELNIKNGSSIFADFSLPIKFKTDIHDLNGKVLSISNQKDEISYVDIVGAVDKYGSTKLKGSFQASNPKLYTDLLFNFRNLELSALSGYVAEFAGYKIKQGKLYLDLNYKIHNSQMVGENKIVIKNIELGEEIEDENVTKLPLGLAIAILEDSNNEINIDMPVEGNIDNPDFKYGKLVIKTFFNIITKAITSPFKFLSKSLGIDSDNLESVDFEAGSSKLLPTELEKLDKLVTILEKRPKISIEITPTYNIISDKKALQAKVLAKRFLSKSKIENEANLKTVFTIDILEDIYLKSKSEESLDKIRESLKKQYKGKVYDIQYQKTLLDMTLAMQKIPQQDYINLAKNRAKVIKDYLLSKNVASQRINIKPVKSYSDKEEKYVKTEISVSIK